jgi:predicted phage baseplate assembly protein
LIELFAWLAEMQMYQLDQISDENYLQFFKLVGLSPRPLQPARVEVVFERPQQGHDVLIEAGTKLIPVGKDDLVFETERETVLTQSRLQAVFSLYDNKVVEQSHANEKAEIAFAPFGDQAPLGAELWLGFDPWFEAPKIHLTIQLFQDDLPPPGDFPDTPPEVTPSVELAWEYYAGPDWLPLTVLEDTTLRLSNSGQLMFLTPLPPAAPAAQKDRGPSRRAYYWIRCRLSQGQYEIAPRISSIRLNVITAVQVETVRDENLGAGSGLPGHTVTVRKPPMYQDDAVIQVTGRQGDWEAWSRVDDFAHSGPDDRHYTLDAQLGEIVFGNGLNGRIPQTSQRIKALYYKTSRGPQGNLPAGQRWRLVRADLSGVRGDNRQPAQHGQAAESIDEAKKRARGALHSRYRAITSADFEELARATPGLRVARAKALPNYHPDFPCLNMPGSVTVVVVPYARSSTVTPQAGRGFLETVQRHLEAHRLLTTDVHVIGPDYLRVAVICNIYVQRQSQPEQVKQRAEKALQGFLNALTGGPEHAGWPLGRPVFPSEIYQLLDAVEGVEYVTGVELRAEAAHYCRSSRLSQHGGGIELPGNGLVYSGTHELQMIKLEQ